MGYLRFLTKRKPQSFLTVASFLLSLLEILFRIYRLTISVKDLEVEMRPCRPSCRSDLRYLLALPYCVTDLYIPSVQMIIVSHHAVIVLDAYTVSVSGISSCVDDCSAIGSDYGCTLRRTDIYCRMVR